MPPQERLRLHNEQRLFPRSNHPCKKHEEYAIRFGIDGSLGVSAEDKQLLAKERVFCHEFGFASGKVCQRPTRREVAVSGLVQSMKRW